MSSLNNFINIASQFDANQRDSAQMASIRQDNQNKTAFALGMMARIPQEPVKPEEAPRIPNLGALAIPS
jgi:hypothetical protein